MKHTIEDFNAIKSVQPVIARKFYKADNAEMIQMRLQNKEAIKKHSVDWDAVFILQKGILHFTENDNEHIIKADDLCQREVLNMALSTTMMRKQCCS